MARVHHAVVPVLGAVLTFLLVVLWPSGIRKPASLRDSSSVHMASVGPDIPRTNRSADPQSQPATTTAPLTWYHPRFQEHQEERDRMTRSTISHPFDGRQAVTASSVIEAMRMVPRHRFVVSGYQAEAHADQPLPIGHGQTISQPYIVALMTEALRIKPGDRILEIGTGSGYQAAVLTELTPNVFSMEIIEPLYQRASKTLNSLGYKTVRCKQGDGYNGWPEHAPFNGIIVTCAAGHVPPPLFQQLAPGGRMVIPIGQPGMYQQLKVVIKDAQSKRPQYETICGVAFVPMVGQIEKP